MSSTRRSELKVVLFIPAQLGIFQNLSSGNENELFAE